MAEAEYTTTTGLPVERVWSFVQDMDNWGRFLTGYQGLVAAQFSDFGWGVTNLYWKQKFAGGKFGLIFGQVDTTDYFNVYAMANPLTMFLNFDFLYPTAAPPNQGLGVAKLI